MSNIVIEYRISLWNSEFRMSQRFRVDGDIFENGPCMDVKNRDPMRMCEEFRWMYNIGARMNFCVVHRVVWCHRGQCLFVAVVFHILLIIEGEVWNVKAKVIP